MWNKHNKTKRNNAIKETFKYSPSSILSIILFFGQKQFVERLSTVRFDDNCKCVMKKYENTNKSTQIRL